MQAHVDEPGILIELLALSDRIDLTLRRFLELQGRSRSDSLDRLATSAADVALQEEAREQASSHGSGAVTPQPWQDPAVWPDFAAFDCPICFDAVTCPEEGSRLKCGHGTCRACAADVVTTAINSAKVTCSVQMGGFCWLKCVGVGSVLSRSRLRRRVSLFAH